MSLEYHIVTAALHLILLSDLIPAFTCHLRYFKHAHLKGPTPKPTFGHIFTSLEQEIWQIHHTSTTRLAARPTYTNAHRHKLDQGPNEKQTNILGVAKARALLGRTHHTQRTTRAERSDSKSNRSKHCPFESTTSGNSTTSLAPHCQQHKERPQPTIQNLRAVGLAHSTPSKVSKRHQFSG